MPPLLGFMIENSVINATPIFFIAALTALVIGPILKKIRANKYVRMVIYSIAGVAAGLLTYSSYDIPDRSFELMEFVYLSFAMFILSLFVVMPVVLFKNRKKT